jgi:hypothetical protein
VSVTFGEGLGDAFVEAIKTQRWESAKSILRERDRGIEDAFTSYSYVPTLTQEGGCTATVTTEAQIYRIDRQIIMTWGAAVGATTGTPSDPYIYISLPPEFDQAVATGIVGASWFESDVLAYSGGGVLFSNANRRLETFADAYAYTSPPNVNGSLPGLQQFGLLATWQLPESKL